MRTAYEYEVTRKFSHLTATKGALGTATKGTLSSEIENMLPDIVPLNQELVNDHNVNNSKEKYSL